MESGIRWFASVCLLSAGPSCSEGAGDTPPPGHVEPAQVGIEDVLAASPQDLWFRQQGEAFVATHQTHEVAVSGGVVRFTPHHFDGVHQSGAPVELTTTSIRRGDDEVASDLATSSIRDGGALSLDRGEVAELLENRDSGLEQAWRFPATPAGTGDLVVTVAVAGHQTVAETESGLHFDTPGALGIRYSNAAWVDSTGTTWRAPATWDGAQVSIVVPGSVLETSSYPAVLDSTISAEVGVDAPAAGYATGPSADEPVVAWGSDAYLVVWRDDSIDNKMDIFARRVSRDGKVLGQGPILLTSSTAFHDDPVVTWTGTSWLVAWLQHSSKSLQTYDIGAATVSATGVVAQLGTVGTPGWDYQPAVASDGGGAMLTWVVELDDVYGAHFDGTGFGPPFAIAPGDPVTQRSPEIAGADGGGYLVVWERNTNPGGVRGQLLASDGAPNGTPFDVTTGGNGPVRPAVAFARTRYVVTWMRDFDIWGTRVSKAGAVLDETGGVGGVPISPVPRSQFNPAVGCDNASCLVTWHETRVADNDTGVYGQRLDLSFQPVGGEITVSDAIRFQQNSAVAGRGSGFLAAWEDKSTGISTIFFAPISAGGVVSSPDALNHASAATQDTPAYARQPQGQLAVWSDSRSLGDDILARRYDSSGTRLEAASLLVSGGPWDHASPAVDFDGTQYVAVWADARDADYGIVAARIGLAGTVSDPGGITVATTTSNAPRPPDVASGGGVSLLVFADHVGGSQTGNNDNLEGAIMTPAGVVGAPFEICASADDEREPRAVWDPSSSLFVVVWSRLQANGDRSVYAARIAVDGTVLDPCGVGVMSGDSGDSPDLAVSGDRILVAAATPLGGIWSTRIDTSGNQLNVLGPETELSSVGSRPTVVGIPDSGWGVAWVDDRNQGVTGTDIWGRTVQTDGTTAGAEYVVSEDVGDEDQPSFQAGTNDKSNAYLVYVRRRTDLNSVRVMRRRLAY